MLIQNIEQVDDGSAGVLCTLLKLLGSERVTDPVSLDFEARMALRGGIGKKIEINDIQLDEYLRQKKTETNE